MSNMLTTLKNNKNLSAALWLLLLIGVYLMHVLLLFGVGGRDDSYITYWSAHALSHFGEIVNYNGDRIEQSSSLLHVLLLAVVHKLTQISLPVLGVALSLCCGLLAALLTFKLMQQLNVRYARWAPFIIIFIPYFTYWSSSGMETSLIALIIVWLMLALGQYLHTATPIKHLASVAFAIAAYVLVRPESFLVLVAFLVALITLALFMRKLPETNKILSIPKILLLLGIATACFIAVSAWRYFYFGQIFPQPVYAKTDIANTSMRIVLGLKYLWYTLDVMNALPIVMILASLFIAWRQRSNRSTTSVVLLLCFVSAYLGFVVCSGGDWMEARRMLVPILPLLAALALFTFDALAQYSKRWAWILLATLCFAGLTSSILLARNESIGLTPQQSRQLLEATGLAAQADGAQQTFDFSYLDRLNYSHLRDMLTLPAFDRLLQQKTQMQTTPIVIASRQMGMIPYYLATRYYKKIRFIDLRGLTTTEIPHCPFLSDNKPHSSSGILMTSQYFLENQVQIDQSCALPVADILFDTGWIGNKIEMTQSVLQASGYEAYYVQQAKTGNMFAQYIAVRK